MALAFGETIATLKATMTLPEVKTWQAWRLKYGPMNDVRRFDRPAALISTIISAVNGGKTNMRDFLPFGMPEENAPEDFAAFVNTIGGGKLGKRR